VWRSCANQIQQDEKLLSLASTRVARGRRKQCSADGGIQTRAADDA
jgi:hypothetical protein